MRVAVIAALICVCTLAVAAGRAQSQSASVAPFEAASIKPNTSGETRIRYETPPGRLTVTNAPLRFLIRQAYRLPESRIVGGPSWIGTERFDVVATGAAGSSDVTRQRLRALLAERFGLAVHEESREMPTYSLELAESSGALGPNLRRSATDCSGQAARVESGRVRCGVLVSQGPGSASLRGGATTLTEFVRQLSDFLDRPVVDRTSLAGTFDLELQFTAIQSALPGASVPGGLTAGADVGEIPSVFTALREQLGLKLDARRGRVDVLVIDRVSQLAEN